jgi:hypothetical protein
MVQRRRGTSLPTAPIVEQARLTGGGRLCGLCLERAAHEWGRGVLIFPMRCFREEPRLMETSVRRQGEPTILRRHGSIGIFRRTKACGLICHEPAHIIVILPNHPGFLTRLSHTGKIRNQAGARQSRDRIRRRRLCEGA